MAPGAPSPALLQQLSQSGLHRAASRRVGMAPEKETPQPLGAACPTAPAPSRQRSSSPSSGGGSRAAVGASCADAAPPGQSRGGDNPHPPPSAPRGTAGPSATRARRWPTGNWLPTRAPRPFPAEPPSSRSAPARAGAGGCPSPGAGPCTCPYGPSWGPSAPSAAPAQVPLQGSAAPGVPATGPSSASQSFSHLSFKAP